MENNSPPNPLLVHISFIFITLLALAVSLSSLTILSSGVWGYFQDDIPFLPDSFSSLPDNLLHGLLLISCGVLGAIASILKDRKVHSIRRLILGALAGFVIFLVVKAGFSISKWGDDALEPYYASAFLSLVAGMFSKKLYMALSNLADKFFNLLNLFGSKKSDNDQDE